MTKFSEVTEDGTYLVDASGTLHRMEYTSGYMVGVKAIGVDTGSAWGFDGEMQKLTLIGRWTDQVTEGYSVVYWDEVEVIDNLLDAGNIARERGELAIWDNFNGCEIRV